MVKENTFFLFREEYKVPLLPPDTTAYLSTIAEHVFPVLLVIGLASRLSALGLLCMTAVIQLFVYPYGWPDHILWAACLLLIIARGPGAISLDHLIWNRVQRLRSLRPHAEPTSVRTRHARPGPGHPRSIRPKAVDGLVKPGHEEVGSGTT